MFVNWKVFFLLLARHLKCCLVAGAMVAYIKPKDYLLARIWGCLTRKTSWTIPCTCSDAMLSSKSSLSHIKDARTSGANCSLLSPRFHLPELCAGKTHWGCRALRACSWGYNITVIIVGALAVTIPLPPWFSPFSGSSYSEPVDKKEIWSLSC